MLGLPKSTEYGRRIPKQKFYENIAVTPALKRAFAEQAEAIYWRSKIAPSTVNLAEGAEVAEIEIFEIKLRAAELDENVLLQIDRAVPYHIIFILEHEGRYRAAVGYKEVAATGASPFKVSQYYYTGWTDGVESLPLCLEGLTMDAAYENFVRQTAGEALAANGGETLKESVERSRRAEQLQKKIAALEARIRREQQPRKKFELAKELRRLQKISATQEDENGEAQNAQP